MILVKIETPILVLNLQPCSGPAAQEWLMAYAEDGS